MSNDTLLLDEEVLIELTDDERREIMRALQESEEQNKSISIPNNYSLFEDISSMDYSEYHDYPNSDGVIDYLQDSEAIADFPDLVDLFDRKF